MNALIYAPEAQIYTSSRVLSIYFIVTLIERLNLHDQFDMYYWKIIVNSYLFINKTELFDIVSGTIFKVAELKKKLLRVYFISLTKSVYIMAL